MKIKKIFFTILFTITIVGFLLRFYQYDSVPPINDSYDEVYYAWAGASWLKEGTPKSWSNFEQYRNFFFREEYGIKWRVVSPFIEKPPLYILLNGILINLAGPDDYFKTPHSLFRLIPLILSLSTIFLVGLVGAKTFSNQIGILAASLYATIPTIVLANRLSLTENLLSPLLLLAIYLFTTDTLKKISYKTLLIGLLSALAILTKQVGIVVGLSFFIIYFFLKSWKSVAVVVISCAIAFTIILLIALHYDWNLFWQIQDQWRLAHTLAGLPEVISSIFRYPGVAAKNHPFVDGSILAGLLLIFTSPMWLLPKIKNKLNISTIFRNEMSIRYKSLSNEFLLSVFVLIPFLYLLLISLNESGSTPFTYFGWYIYPLFPFLTILLAKVLVDFYKNPNVFYLIFFHLFLTISTIRFIFITVSRQYQYLWQYTLIFVIVTSFSILLFNKKISKFIMYAFLLFYLLVNVYTVINLEEIYDYTIKNSDLSSFNN